MCCFRIGTSLGQKTKFKSRPQNRILVPLRDSFQNFQRAPPSFIYGFMKIKQDNTGDDDLQRHNAYYVISQTRATVFHRDIQTPRRELKIRRAAEYF